MQRFLVLTLLTLLASGAAFGQLASTATWEVRPTNGNDNYGGCFDPAIGIGTDYTQQNAVEYNFTDLVISATTTNVTSVSHSFVVADTGNCIHISAGSGFTTGWYEIHSTSGGIATLDRSAGSAASTGGTWFEGGALKTFSQFTLNIGVGQMAWMKAESTQTIGSGLIWSNGAASAGSQFTTIAGYTSTRGDGGQVTIQASTTINAWMLQFEAAGASLMNFIFDCNSEGPAFGAGGITGTGGTQRFQNITVKNCNWNNGNSLIINGAHSTLVTVTVQNSSTSGASNNDALVINAAGIQCFWCVAVGNSQPGILATGTANNDFKCVFCIAANNSGASSDGITFVLDSAISACIGCVTYGNGRDGIRIGSSDPGSMIVMNSIAYGNAAYGINFTGTATLAGVLFSNYNAYGGNTSGNLNGLTAGAQDKTLSASPFINAASDNFALSTGGVTAVGGLGFAGTLNVGGTGNLDIGALQHAVAAGSGPKGFPIVQ